MLFKKYGIIREVPEAQKEKYIDKGYKELKTKDIKKPVVETKISLLDEEKEKLTTMTVDEMKDFAKEKNINIGNTASPEKITEKILKASI